MMESGLVSLARSLGIPECANWPSSEAHDYSKLPFRGWFGPAFDKIASELDLSQMFGDEADEGVIIVGKS
jgi:hypothetical protein